MVYLTDELLEVIFDECDFASQKKCRLVNRQFDAVCAPRIFEHVHLASFNYSLGNLDALANSTLSKHVKQFTAYVDQLPLMNHEEWARIINLRPPFMEYMQAREATGASNRAQAFADYNRLPRHTMTEEEVNDAYDRGYRPLLTEQMHWYQNELTNRFRFKSAFSKLPCVRKANAVEALPFQEGHNNRPPWKSLRRKTLVGPDNFKTCQPNPLSHCNSLNLFQGKVRADPLVLWLLEAIGHRATLAGIEHVTDLNLDGIENYSLGVHAIDKSAPLQGKSHILSFNANPQVSWLTTVESFKRLKNSASMSRKLRLLNIIRK